MVTENPKILGFVCRHAEDRIEEKIGSLAQNGVRIYPFTCGASILPATVVEAFTGGVDAVFLLVCGEGNCRYYDGHMKIERKIAGIQTLLEDIGLDSKRLLISHADKYEEDPLDGVLIESTKLAKGLSKNPYGPKTAESADDGDKRTSGPKSSHSRKGEREE